MRRGNRQPRFGKVENQEISTWGMNQLFYTQKIENGFAVFEEEEGRHLKTVLRKKSGDLLHLTDGQGSFYEAELSETGKHQVLARIVSKTSVAPQVSDLLHIGIAPTKMMERLEWFMEKATELGVGQITPLICQRSERDNLRLDRLEKILVSAMKQSLRAWLPKLNPPTRFKDFVQQATEVQKRIAWCSEEPLQHLKNSIVASQSTVICIGPEGDFAPEEVALALSNGFQGVGLGETRLRTETAGLLAVSVFQLLNVETRQ